MSETKKIQTGINNISEEWFRANIDRKTLKKLSKRSDFEGWKHIIIYAISLTALCALSVYACLLYTSPSPRDLSTSRMPSSA